MIKCRKGLVETLIIAGQEVEAIERKMPLLEGWVTDAIIRETPFSKPETVYARSERVWNRRGQLWVTMTVGLGAYGADPEIFDHPGYARLSEGILDEFGYLSETVDCSPPATPCTHGKGSCFNCVTVDQMHEYSNSHYEEWRKK
jgi:hypothetical protein